MTAMAWNRRRGMVALGVLLLVVGWSIVAVALGMGHSAAFAEYTGTPRCDGQTMVPGDSCITLGSGGAGSGTYQEIVAGKGTSATAEAWGWAEATGGLGAVLIFAGAATAGFAGRLSARVNAWLTLAIATLPLLVVAGVVGHLQARAEAASPMPVGFLRVHWWWPEMPYSAVLTVAAVLGATAVCLGNIWRRAGGMAQQRSDELRARREAATQAFEEGRTDDPWAALRISAPLPAHYPALVMRLVRAVGAALFLAAGAMNIGTRVTGVDLPAAVPGLTVLVGWGFFTAHGLRLSTGTMASWSYGASALLFLKATIAAMLSLSATTWSGLLNVLVFACGFWTAASWYGMALPRPPVAGRFVYTVIGVTQSQVAVVLAVTAAAPASGGFAGVAAYFLSGVLLVSAGVSFHRARMTESQGAVPAAVSVACLGTSSLALALTGGCAALLEGGPLGWGIAGSYVLSSVLQIRAALGHLGLARRTGSPGAAQARSSPGPAPETEGDTCRGPRPFRRAK